MEKYLQEKIEGPHCENKVIRLRNKFKYAFSGLNNAVINHSSFIIHITVGFIACFLSLIFDLSSTEIMFVLSAIFFVLIAELINTSVEETINLFTKEIKRGAMLAKDSAAAAVLLASFYAILIGVIIFVPKIIGFIIEKF